MRVSRKKLEVSDEPQLYKRPKIKARTENQQRYIDVILNSKVTICAGIAGTGKTAIAVGIGIDLVLHKEYNRIVLIRPIAEAGEYLGALPGDLFSKVEQSYMCLIDELNSTIHYSEFKQYIANSKSYKWPGIEIAPIAFLRGRSLNNCFIVLDEAQNCTVKQLKMVISRLGLGSKLVITGDTKQSDIQNSGLEHLIKNLRGIRNVGFVSLTTDDIQRDPIIGEILDRI